MCRTLFAAKVMLVCVLFIFIACLSFGGWINQENKDEMTGEIIKVACSKDTPPTAGMNFPYRNVTGNIFVGRNGANEFAAFGFTEQPNLLNVDLQQNRNIIRTRIKWDDKLQNVTLIQKWGDRFLHFSDTKDAIIKIMSAKEVLLELDWYGSGKVYFKFDLTGSSKAIGNVRK